MPSYQMSPMALTSTDHEESSPPHVTASPNEAKKSLQSTAQSCPICLNSITDTAFLDPCFHMFCFHCILQWAEVVSKHPSMEGETHLECPLCKACSYCIIHSFFLDTFQRHYLFGPLHVEMRPFSPSPAHYQRLYVYKNSLQAYIAEEVNQNIKCRKRFFHVSGNVNVEQWVRRELQALMRVEDVDLIAQHVLGILKHFEDKQSVASHTQVMWVDAMIDAVRPFIFENAESFCVELRNFLSSGLNVKAYDLLVEEALRSNTLKLFHTINGSKVNDCRYSSREAFEV